MTCILLAAAALPVEASSCDPAKMQSKMSECMMPLMQGAQSGNVCGAWNTFECCLVDSVASCGASEQQAVKTTIASTKTTYKDNPVFKGLSECAAASCGSAGSAPAAPVEADTALMATINLVDPSTWDLDAYIAAAKKHTGASAVTAVLKSLEILVKYGLPASESIPLSNIKAAIAKANSVQESHISLESNEGRRLSTQRLLAASGTSLDVTISVPDADTAAKVKASASDVESLGSELGVKVSLSKEPVAVAKVATIVTSDPSESSTLKSNLEKVGGDIGGTVAAADVSPGPTVPSTSAASSTFGFMLAPIMALVTAVVAAM